MEIENNHQNQIAQQKLIEISEKISQFKCEKDIIVKKLKLLGLHNITSPEKEKSMQEELERERLKNREELN